MDEADLAAGGGRADRAAQEGLRAAGLDGWLLYDFQGKNPIFFQLLGGPRHTTRRCYLLIPREGEPRLLIHRIDVPALQPFGVEIETYLTWPELASRAAALPRRRGAGWRWTTRPARCCRSSRAPTPARSSWCARSGSRSSRRPT